MPELKHKTKKKKLQKDFDKAISKALAKVVSKYKNVTTGDVCEAMASQIIIKNRIAVIPDSAESYNEYVREHGKANTGYLHISNTDDDYINYLKSCEIDAIVITGNVGRINNLQEKIDFAVNRIR